MVILFDIGGTNIKWGISDKNGTLLRRESVPTQKNVIHQIHSLTEDILQSFPASLAVGISVAANVNRGGIITRSTNLDFQEHFSFQSFFRDSFNLKAACCNDGTAAAMALANDPRFSHYKDFCAVTMGTGIGGGIVLDRKVLKTVNGLEAEIGHITVKQDGELCPCGKKGCLEAYCGSGGIIKRFNAINDTHTDSVKRIFELAQKGNHTALHIIKETSKLLGLGFTIISDILGVEAFLVGGGVSGLGELLFSDIKDYMGKNAFGRNINCVPDVIKVNDTDYLSLRGAYYLIKNDLK